MTEHDPCFAGKGDMGYPSDCELTQGLLARSREASRPVERSEEWCQALPRAAQVQLLLLDVDGVLTDGTIIYTPDGGESKGFNFATGACNTSSPGTKISRTAAAAWVSKAGASPARRSDRP